MADNHRQEMIENFSKYRIGLDEKFAFKCRACGKCCRNREDILLNPQDVYNLAIALNITHEQVIATYCEVYIGESSRIPIIRLMPKGLNKVCPLLKNDRCSVHLIEPSLKPTVCRLAPLGRVALHKGAAEVMDVSNLGKVEYILNDFACASAKRKQTVRQYLTEFGIPIEDEFFKAWNETLYSLVMAMQKVEAKPHATQKSIEMLRGGIFQAIYLQYDTQLNFLSQFIANADKILTLFGKLDEFEIAPEDGAD
ncbi:MAG: YkgJ family cysteine cluster protein [Oscillospiraceae bacterium]|nr:YkgJ family cysteine cluster protein [Oscillospiraceae bacterium]